MPFLNNKSMLRQKATGKCQWLSLRKEGDLPILRIAASTLLLLCVLPPGDLVDEIRQLVPELVGQRTLST